MARSSADLKRCTISAIIFHIDQFVLDVNYLKVRNVNIVHFWGSTNNSQNSLFEFKAKHGLDSIKQKYKL
jgi:hypothetical protein